MHRPFRKPLIILTPKSLLRHKKAVSPVDALTSGHFAEVLDDRETDPAGVRRLLLCSGKVFYDLLEKRAADGRTEVAIVRMEQFYPFPMDLLRRTLGQYKGAKEIIWVQEESMNMGGWAFMEPRLRALGYPPRYVGRDSSASPATGSYRIHRREQMELVEAAVSGHAPFLARAHGPAPVDGFRGRVAGSQAPSVKLPAAPPKEEMAKSKRS
jgi:2-oxoglutarate dehydrogenase E1 component